MTLIEDEFKTDVFHWKQKECGPVSAHPLLLSEAAMGLLEPVGYRWHRNPPSRSEKVT